MILIIPIIIILAIGFVFYWIVKINSSKQGEIQINQAKEVSDMLKSAQKKKVFFTDFQSTPKEHTSRNSAGNNSEPAVPGLPEEVKLSQTDHPADEDSAAGSSPSEPLPQDAPEVLPATEENAGSAAQPDETTLPDVSVTPPAAVEEDNATSADNVFETPDHEIRISEDAPTTEAAKTTPSEPEEKPAKPKRKYTRKAKTENPDNTEDTQKDQ